ncbi:DUF3455 domain-containing protein [Actinoplanes sp. NPDC049316]|uniref:DUF3455 domain-containing protein n=1 Tax=Actinoplanes sp. NPDC049316 TaxID=3154727 RepID=UPI00342658D7
MRSAGAGHRTPLPLVGPRSRDIGRERADLRVSRRGEPAGQGILSSVTHIQRMNTSGGVAPATACADGEKVSVPHQADYLFWGN